MNDPGTRRGRALVWSGILGLIAALSGSSLTWADSETFRFDTPGRVIAFGDVHGALPEMKELFRSLGIVDPDGRWSAGTTHLVSLGDLLDRGAQSRAVMDFLMELQVQARAAGGRVHLVLGNHETMNLTGDLRYVSAGEYEAFARDEDPQVRAAAWQALSAFDPALTVQAAFDEAYPPGYFAHRQAFSRSGRYGAWLLAQPVVVAVNDTAFIHGGLSPWVAEQNLQSLNTRMRAETVRLLELGELFVSNAGIRPWGDLLTAVPNLGGSADEVPLQDGSTVAELAEWAQLQSSPLFGDQGPNWYRGTADCHRLVEEATLEAALTALKVSRVVVGHTPTSDRRIQSRFDGRALLADTGMLKSYYRGRPSAVVFEDATVRAFYPGEVTAREFTAPPVDLRTGNDRALLDALTELDLSTWPKEVPQTVELLGERYSAIFATGSKRALRNRLAAFRLDKLLGLGLVPPTVERESDGRRGTLTLLPADRVTERQRSERQLRRPNWCGKGDDYQLMYAFDTLLGQESRSADDIVYDTTHWLLFLTGHDEAFGSAVNEPAYLIDTDYRLPAALAQRLRELQDDELTQSLGDLLSRRQRNALAQRSRSLLERRGDK